MELLPKHYSHRLSNGLEVVTIPINRGSGVISAQLYFKVGSRNEVLGKTGIAHMLEHMSFKSTQNLKEGEFDRIVKEMGGVDNAATSFDFTYYFIKVASRYLPKSLELFREIMANLALKEEEFQRERKVVYEERLWRVDNSPPGYLNFRLFNNAFIYHPYHWTPIGFKEDILNWTIEDIRHFYKTYYAPNNAVLVVAGDISPDEVKKEAEKWFGDLPPSQLPPPLHQKEPPLDGDKLVEIRRGRGGPVQLLIAFHIPPFNHPDILKLDVIGELLTRWHTSRLVERFFYRERKVSSIYAFPYSLRDGGLFIIGAVCNEGVDPIQLTREIRKELGDLRFTDQQLKKVQKNTLFDFLSSFETAAETAHLFGEYLAMGDLNPLLTYYDRLRQLTPDDLKKMEGYFEKGVTAILYPTGS